MKNDRMSKRGHRVYRTYAKAIIAMRGKLFAAVLAAALLCSCADPAFQQYIQNREAAISAMPNGYAKAEAQERLDQQILADKQRQNQQAANAAIAIAGGIAAGAAAYNATRPVYIYPVYRPWWAY
jgi:hypothetical protein